MSADRLEYRGVMVKKRARDLTVGMRVQLRGRRRLYLCTVTSERGRGGYATLQDAARNQIQRISPDYPVLIPLEDDERNDDVAGEWWYAPLCTLGVAFALVLFFACLVRWDDEALRAVELESEPRVERVEALERVPTMQEIETARADERRMKAGEGVE